MLHGSALEDPRPLSNWRWAALALLLSTVAVAARLHAEHWRKAQRADADAVTKFVAARHR